MAVQDPIKAGLAAGWDVRNGAVIEHGATLEADVAIIGTGAGGGTAAEILTQAGLKVVMLEDGPLKSSDSFADMEEARAWEDLYQESGSRATKDGAIAIFQGRSVGGTTVVNWTSSFRTPDDTLKHWGEVHGVEGVDPASMQPWFEQMEKRLNIHKWPVPPNSNNEALAKGCEALGWEWDVIPRNVKGCWNIGYCGMGCPSNAKQSMLVTTIPSALNDGATLVHNARVKKVLHSDGRVTGLSVQGIGNDNRRPTGSLFNVKAKRYVLAGGAINSPALLLHSDAPNPSGLLGKRTFVHPVPVTLAEFDEDVEGWHGAPQSTYSDQFVFRDGAAGALGYKLEVAPTYPGLMASALGGIGEMLFDRMAKLKNLSCAAALLRDGFNEQSPGATVSVDDEGYPIIEYEINDYLWEGVKSAIASMTEAQFAAGAKSVLVSHLDAKPWHSWEEAKVGIENLAYEPVKVTLYSAHLMGGCQLGKDEKTAVCDSNGNYFGLDNLSVFDGSIFPTSIGANPQLSIYGLVAKLATQLADDMTGPVQAGL